MPTGTVSFYDDGLLLGKAQLDNGTAKFSTSSLSGGTHTISARYEGDDTHEDSASDEVLHEVIGTPPQAGYIITAGSDASTTITPEGSVTVQKGNNQRFDFSALPGYAISAVTVDGRPLTHEQIAYGYYVFYDVSSNHTVEVMGFIGSAITLTIDIIEGKGYAEFRVDDGPFQRYTAPVLLPSNADLTVRAVAENGYEFREWKEGTLTYTASEHPFPDVSSSIHLELYFGEKSDSDGFPLHIVFLMFLLAAALFLIWFFFRRRQSSEDEQRVREAEGHN
jgi:hypothetical protein